MPKSDEHIALEALAAARADALDEITSALGEHPDTDLKFLVNKIRHIRAEARHSADAYSRGRAEQHAECVRLLRWADDSPAGADECANWLEARSHD